MWPRTPRRSPPSPPPMPMPAPATYSPAAAPIWPLFSINSATGALSFISAPNYEAPTRRHADNVWRRHRAGLGRSQHRQRQALAVTVTNVNDADGHQQRHRIRGREHHRRHDGHCFDPTLLRHLHTPSPVRRRGQVQHHQRHRRPDLLPRRLTTRARPMSVPTTSITSLCRSRMARHQQGRRRHRHHVNEAPTLTSAASASVAENTTAVSDGHCFDLTRYDTAIRPPAAPTRPSSVSIAPPAP